MRHLYRSAYLLACLLFASGCDDNRTVVETLPPAEGVPAEALSCVPNLDGQLDASEITATLGVPARFRVTPPGATTAIDLDGDVNASGRRVWDMSTREATDQLAEISATKLNAWWFAADFAGISGADSAFVLPLDVAGTTVGVYTQDSDGLYLHGLASSEAHPSSGRTLMIYDAAVTLQRYPMSLGDGWSAVGEVRNATFRDLPYAGRDTYTVEVTASGRLELVDFAFTQALQVKTRLLVQPSVGAATSRWQVSWLFECFGEVARAVSLDDEPSSDFGTAAELRRLGL